MMNLSYSRPVEFAQIAALHFTSETHWSPSLLETNHHYLYAALYIVAHQAVYRRAQVYEIAPQSALVSMHERD
jgi:hypothetical protein